MDKTVVVPVEPTDEMIEATWSLNGEKFTVDAIYKAMIAAAPAPAAQWGREAFNAWWDAEKLTQTNPFHEDSPAYWAWEGWQARAALTAPQSDEVAIPTHEDQAALMVLLGTRWLQENAPHRLTAPQDAQERDAIIANLAMLVRRLSLSLNRYASHHGLADQAMNYLQEIGMFGSPLRATVQPADKPELLCKSCGADRSKECCNGDWMNCDFGGVAYAADKPEGKAEQQMTPAKDCTIDSFSRSTVDGYVRFLTWAVWRDHYADTSPNFQLLTDTFGVLTQLDNMLTGWEKEQPAQPQQLTDSAIRELAHEHLKGTGDHCIINFARALLAAEKKEPLEMRLCEASRVWLKPNQPYIFTVDPNCEQCVAAAKRAEG